MKEQLISFETAKLAKEKGFNISNSGYVYDKKGGKVMDTPIDKLIWSGKYPAPTQSLLQKWLREKHEIHVSAFPVFSDKYFTVIRKFYKYKGYDNILGSPYDPYSPTATYEEAVDTYEKALEKGLQSALKLIN